jgi:hypothetical protein
MHNTFPAKLLTFYATALTALVISACDGQVPREHSFDQRECREAPLWTERADGKKLFKFTCSREVWREADGVK